MARIATFAKSVVALTALLFACGAAAETVIVNVSHKASPVTTFATALKDAIPDARVYHASSCEDGKKMFAKTPGALFVYNSSVDFSSRLQDKDCQMMPNKAALLLAEQYFRVCTKRGSGNVWGHSPALMGMASMYSTPAFEADLNAAGARVKLVPFGGSKEILAAVLNGDMQFGFLGGSMAKSPELDCQFSTNVKDKDFIGSRMKLKVPDMRINIIVYANGNFNATLPAANSKPFADFVKRGEYVARWYPTQNELQGVSTFVDHFYQSYK